LKNNSETVETNNWFLKNTDEVFKELKSSKNGLDESEAKKRLEQYGLNKIETEEKNKILKILLRNFNSILIYILLTASIISLFSGHLVEFVVVIIIIFVTGFAGFIQEYNAGKALEALSKLTVKTVFVLREGIKKKIKAEDLVIGDLVYLERGMIIPADLRVYQSNNLSVNESILTGESNSKYKLSDAIEKQEVFIAEQHNMLFSGTGITNGHGLGIVVATGINSEIGKISHTLRKIGNKVSPLQKQITSMSKKLSYVVLAICVMLFFTQLIQGINIFDILLLVSAVAVSGIPESFPLALTLALSFGVKRMAKKNAIVKDLTSVETLGTCTIICTDKTGTLTENKMVAEKIYFADGLEISVDGNNYEPKSKFIFGNKPYDIKHLKNYSSFFKASILCNNSEINFNNEEWDLLGEPTEGAILCLAKSAGYQDQVLREENNRVFEIPFDPFEKYMLTMNKDIHSPKTKYDLYLKGAVEKIIAKCSYIRTKDGKIKKLQKTDIEKINKLVDKYTADTYRVLSIATKIISGKIDLKKPKSFENKLKLDFIFEGLVAIRDPIRKEVFQAIEECKTANVKVVMITGDHKSTAMSVGKQLGLINSKRDLVLEGKELDEMTDDELDEIIMKVSIFSRTTPNHKYRIVCSLQRKEQIVAMTGDGVNDAPALKKADIGVSMGKTGTDVARESSNMILMDDNFATIVNAIKEGRTIYSNIRRFIYYILPGNITEVSLILFTTLLGILTPLTAIMILFVNIVTSTIPSMALSVEPTHPKVMSQRPRNSKQNLLSKYVLLKTFAISPIIFIGTILLFLWELKIQGVGIEKARTIAFATIIIFELFHALNSRSLHTTIFNKNFFANKSIFVALVASIFLTFFTIQTTIGNTFFKTVPLLASDWITIFLVSISVVIYAEIVKALVNSELKEQQSLSTPIHTMD
jgi:P-type Ca2+ transporter type 2C